MVQHESTACNHMLWERKTLQRKYTNKNTENTQTKLHDSDFRISFKTENPARNARHINRVACVGGKKGPAKDAPHTGVNLGCFPTPCNQFSTTWLGFIHKSSMFIEFFIWLRHLRTGKSWEDARTAKENPRNCSCGQNLTRLGGDLCIQQVQEGVNQTQIQSNHTKP